MKKILKLNIMEKISTITRNKKIVKEIFRLSSDEIAGLIAKSLTTEGKAQKNPKLKAHVEEYIPRFITLVVEYEVPPSKAELRLKAQETKKREKFIKWADTITLEDAFKDMRVIIPNAGSMITRLKNTARRLLNDGSSMKDEKLSEIIKYPFKDLIKLRGISKKSLMVLNDYFMIKGCPPNEIDF